MVYFKKSTAVAVLPECAELALSGFFGSPKIRRLVRAVAGDTPNKSNQISKTALHVVPKKLEKR